MKKVFLALIALSTLAACKQASSSNNAKADSTTTVSAANLPVMKFERETHDFGKVKSGDVVKYDFKFTNTGKSPLIITNATATCGCTKPDYPKSPVAPGENGVIHVEFNSTGKMGLQDKQITITANTNPAESRVHLIGDVTVDSK
ncbi:DUF1573 domain-containing protein [Mucilaginibacter sp. KACC 22063]|uniref:DUF1573 domain-containing protein n=1 Tax=Mucilaginibacter sp. KACC 22063 TaxID=3025666 RepID=UPI0023670548|nr:DUF1573 domain-containing protein [Mucilaginibacter sp. KACC 22063]WDF56961.1 DUF1573 domain-containing protein [Mucilaginibacter sp. KACC 22063]